MTPWISNEGGEVAMEDEGTRKSQIPVCGIQVLRHLA